MQSLNKLQSPDAKLLILSMKQTYAIISNISFGSLKGIKVRRRQ